MYNLIRQDVRKNGTRISDYEREDKTKFQVALFHGVDVSTGEWTWDENAERRMADSINSRKN